MYFFSYVCVPFVIEAVNPKKTHLEAKPGVRRHHIVEHLDHFLGCHLQLCGPYFCSKLEVIESSVGAALRASN